MAIKERSDPECAGSDNSTQSLLERNKNREENKGKKEKNKGLLIKKIKKERAEDT